MVNNLNIKSFSVTLVVLLILLTLGEPVFSQAPEIFRTFGSWELAEDGIVFQFELVNSAKKMQNLQFSSGQQFEIIVTDEDGKEIYRYSDGKAFTMALIYRFLAPGEKLNWQEKWDLTDKAGKALLPGQYTAEIRILTVPKGQAYEEVAEQLTTEIRLELGAEEIIAKTAEQVITALQAEDMAQLAAFVHPKKGVRFTPYTYVSFEQDLVFDREKIANFLLDENEYLWGYYDGTGCDILLTPAQYYKKFVYTHDFKNADEIGYNEVLSFGNMLENQFEVYDNPIIVEYYFPGFNPDFAGLDWRSLRLVFEQYKGGWYLVGIIYNQWTI